MAGCALNGKPKSITPSAPPQPQSPASSTPAPPSEPLSIPQTQVELPPLQPVNQEAIAAAALPEPAEAPPAPKPVRRTTGGAPPPKPESAAPAATPAEPERAHIQEIVPADELRRYRESADAHKRETRQLLQQARAHRLTSDQNKVVKRIEVFLTQSDDAEKRGDMRQADALAERGLALAKELAGGK